MTECSHDNIISSNDVCAFIDNNCQNESGYFNFISFYYCTLDQSIALLIIISLVFALLVFNFLGAISNSYLAPSLEVVSRKLKLSETMSGITLLAFAASAPDVITGLVAGGRAESGIRIAVGGLFGACLFTITIVLAGCILGAKKIEADKKDLGRDIGFLMMTMLYFVALTLVEEVTPPLAAGFFGLYVLYFLFVLYQERSKAKKKIEPVQEDLLNLDIEISEGDANAAEKFRRLGSGPLIMKEVRSQNDADSAANALRMRYTSSWRTGRQAEKPIVFVARPVNKKITKRAHTVGDISINSASVKKEEPMEIIDEVAEEGQEGQEGQEAHGKPSHVHRILKWMNAPVIFVGDLTMPPVESHRWNLYMAALTPVLGPLFVLWTFGIYKTLGAEWYLWIAFGVVTLAMAILMIIFGRKKNLTEKYPGIFATVTLIISIVWLNLVSSLIVDFLTFIQVLTGISLYYLSITLLAWGNSLEDYFVNHAIAKKGHGKAALGGVYGSQIFAIMIGFGGGLFRSALNQPVNMNIYNFKNGDVRENLMITFLLGTIILTLILTMGAGKLKKWVLERKVAVFVFVLYSVFAIATTLIAFV